jgi:hypothetical protein
MGVFWSTRCRKSGSDATETELFACGSRSLGAATSPSAALTRRPLTRSSARRWRQAGATTGRPGPRPQYHAAQDGAFVLDPDGNNIEEVCHDARLTHGAALPGAHIVVGAAAPRTRAGRSPSSA